MIDRLGLATDSLYTRIKTGEVYYPALLSAREELTSGTGYAFVFRSGAGIDATCTIARRDEGAQVVRSFECYEDYGGTIVIEWDGRDERGQAVPAGVHVLKIEGEMLARTFRPLRQSVSFWHRGPID